MIAPADPPIAEPISTPTAVLSLPAMTPPSTPPAAPPIAPPFTALLDLQLTAPNVVVAIRVAIKSLLVVFISYIV